MLSLTVFLMHPSFSTHLAATLQGANMAQAIACGKVISAGSAEIDKELGGGIPLGPLILLEGASDSGKSVLS